MLFSVEQAFVGRDEIRAPLKRPAPKATPKGTECEMAHFLASMGCNLILHIHVIGSIDSCQKRVSADQYHMIVSLVQVLTHCR